MKILKIVFIVILLSIVAANGYNYTMSGKKILKIWSPRVPFSVDPLEYDALAHHICFRSIYSSLASEYKLGEFQGAVAERWETNGDKSEWTFFIRPNISFSNGDPISAEQVALSLNRAALLMHRKGSESGLFEFLVGRDQLTEANKLASGISIDGNTVKLTFDRPMPELLTKIGFGLYAIVHSNDYEPDSGNWKNSREIIASGPYQIEAWTKESLTLRLRKNFPQSLLLKRHIEKAVFTFSADNILDSDLVVDFDDSLAPDKNFQFFGPIKSAIRYVVCESWEVASSACHRKEDRIKLRNQFYKELSAQNFKHTKSFFPLAIHGIHEFDLPKISDERVDFAGAELTVSQVNPANKNVASKSLVTPQEAFQNAVVNMSKRFNFVPKVYISNVIST